MRLPFTKCVQLLLILTASYTAGAQTEGSSKPKVLNLQEVINARVFPKRLKEAPKEGKVVMDIWLNREGQILKYKAIIAENPDLQAFIEDRVPLLEFAPARDVHGVAIYSKVRLPFEFSMNEQEKTIEY